MPTGSVKWFNKAKGYGFLKPDEGGKDLFLHVSALVNGQEAEMVEGRRVSFDVERKKDGRTVAARVRAL